MKVWKFVAPGRCSAVAIAETEEEARGLVKAHANTYHLDAGWLDEPLVLVTSYECTTPSWVAWTQI